MDESSTTTRRDSRWPAEEPGFTSGRSWSDAAIFQLTLVRYREFFREPEAVFWVFIFPVLLAAGLGIAFRNRAPERVRIGVQAGASRAESLVKRLQGEQRLSVELLSDSAAAHALRAGQIALLVAPSGDSALTYLYDDTRPDGRTARLLLDEAVQRAAGRRDPVPITETLVREPGSRYIDFVLPGLLGMNLMGSGIWGLGFAIVEARRKKLLKRLIATPMSRLEYLASFLVSRLTLLVIEVAVLLGFGVVAFDVPVRGSLPALVSLTLLGSLAFSALGLLIAARPRTMEGASGLMNLVMLPMWIFSGVFFSTANFPPAFQPLIQALPLTALNDALRAHMLQGADWSALLPELAILMGWLVVSFVLALRIFRWQ